MNLLSCLLMAFALVGVAEDKLEKPAVLDGFTLEHNIGKDNLPVDGKMTETAGWVESDFDGKGEVKIENGTAILGKGNDMTGIRWTGPLAKMNYEISLEAKRVEGSDFFCGLTFPYGETPCSFIVGGWGGTVVGISSLDFQDAYNNETCQFKKFEPDKWYTIRVRVTPNWIQAWIDDDQLVKVKTTGRDIGIRSEVEKSRPLGVATWRTTGAIRNVNLNVYTKPPEEPKDEAE
ncbi:MAG: DUF1080 domain-containing protein [Candidatus Hydrogenedentes bacterium]|nr:DUF1080 domain-containing protein [Candidatus Hydrogenedentota bacterium]